MEGADESIVKAALVDNALDESVGSIASVFSLKDDETPIKNSTPQDPLKKSTTQSTKNSPTKSATRKSPRKSPTKNSPRKSPTRKSPKKMRGELAYFYY
jgi:hypothetical protein